MQHVTSAFQNCAENTAISMEKLRRAGDFAHSALNSMGDAVACTDVAGNITYLNAAAETMTGWSEREALGKPVAEVLRMLDSRSPQLTADPVANESGGNQTVHLPCDTVLLRRDGTTVQVEDSAAPIHDGNGHVTGSVIVLRDVGQARTHVLQMTHSAHHDALTGLPNRVLLHDRIGRAIAVSTRHHRKCAVLFLDLDNFKPINDSLGHHVGDKLLQSVAQRLIECVRSGDTVSRLGGDEFVVLLSEVDSMEEAAAAANRMLRAITTVHSIDQQDFHLTASIGVSFFPTDGPDPETLIRNADTAMYLAKKNGRQRYQFFEPTMHVRAVERQALEEGLRAALASHEMEVFYQPKVSLATRAVVGAEALLRWTHPVRGPIPPGEFIPAAESCGLMQTIGAWVLRQACVQARDWRGQGLPAITMAVNVSPTEFRNEAYLEDLLSILGDSGLDANCLELEPTESVMINRLESTLNTLRSVRERGINVVVDDFGTGNSSLSHLRHFPVSAIKIDRSFINQIGKAGEDSTMVIAAIGMARNLKLRVIAEGVETQEQLRFLRYHHCDEAQGHYFGLPVPPLQFAGLLKAGGFTSPPLAPRKTARLPAGL